MKIRLTLLTGGTIDFDAPPDFNLVGWVTSVRESGRWLMDGIYIPADSILCVLRLREDGQPENFKVEGTLQ